LVTDAVDAGFKDRSTGLVLFGIILVLVGVACALFIPLTLLTVALSTAMEEYGVAPMSPRTVVPGLSLYAILAVAFMWLGIGSIRARRWVRPIVLVLSWLWLAVGVVAIVFVVFMGPAVYEEMAATGALPAEAVVVVRLVVVLVLTCLYILLPGTLVLFYRSDNVRATLEARDRRIRWTDTCPSHIISLCVLYVLTAYFVLLTPVYGLVVPVFGTVLSGVPAALVLLVSLILCGYLTWGTLKRDVAAWWVSVVAATVATASFSWTLLSVGLAELYSRMQLPDEQLLLMRHYGLESQTLMLVLTIVTWAVFVAYMAYARRFFHARALRPEV